MKIATIRTVVVVVLLALALDGRAQSVRWRARSSEGLNGVETLCDFVDTNSGDRLRIIMTRPLGTSERLPAVLFVQWLSCDTVELSATAQDGWTRMLRGVIEDSGMLFVRTEKAGVGDSDGTPCDQLDYVNELAGHRAALEFLKRSEFVDPKRIVIFGASMGGTMAPLLAHDGGIRGLMIWGSTGVSWAEHMIRLDRRVLELQGIAVADVSRRMAAQIRLHALYLGNQLTPSEISRDYPDLSEVWQQTLGTGAEHQYGRSILFHHQAQRANWEAAWGAVDVPILVVRGEYDWIMGESEHRRIADIVSRRDATLATFVTVPQMDHHFEVYESAQAAFEGKGGRFDAAVLNVLLEWLRRVQDTSS